MHLLRIKLPDLEKRGSGGGNADRGDISKEGTPG
jgi:hypothetical protein